MTSLKAKLATNPLLVCTPGRERSLSDVGTPQALNIKCVLLNTWYTVVSHLDGWVARQTDR